MARTPFDNGGGGGGDDGSSSTSDTDPFGDGSTGSETIRDGGDTSRSDSTSSGNSDTDSGGGDDTDPFGDGSTGSETIRDGGDTSRSDSTSSGNADTGGDTDRGDTDRGDTDRGDTDTGGYNPGGDTSETTTQEPGFERRTENSGILENQTQYRPGVVGGANRIEDRIADRTGITDRRNFDIRYNDGEYSVEFSPRARSKIVVDRAAEQTGLAAGDLEPVRTDDGEIGVRRTDRPEQVEDPFAFGGIVDDTPPGRSSSTSSSSANRNPFGGGLNAPTASTVLREDVRGNLESRGFDPDSVGVQVQREGEEFAATLTDTPDRLDDVARSTTETGERIPDNRDPASNTALDLLPSGLESAARDAANFQQGADAAVQDFLDTSFSDVRDPVESTLSDVRSGVTSTADDAADAVVDTAEGVAENPGDALFAVPRAAVNATNEDTADQAGRAAVSAGAAGVVAPEPSTTLGGAAIIGTAALLGAGTSEIDIPDPTSSDNSEIEPAEQNQNELEPTDGQPTELPATDGTVAEIEVPAGDAGTGTDTGEIDLPAQTGGAVPDAPTGPDPFEDVTPNAPAVPEPEIGEQETPDRGEQVSQRGGTAFVNDDTPSVEEAQEPTVDVFSEAEPEFGDAAGTGFGTGVGPDAGSGVLDGLTVGVSPFGEGSATPNAGGNVDVTADATPTTNTTPTTNPATGNPPAFETPTPNEPGFPNPNLPEFNDTPAANLPGDPTGSGRTPRDLPRPAVPDTEPASGDTDDTGTSEVVENPVRTLDAAFLFGDGDTDDDELFGGGL